MGNVKGQNDALLFFIFGCGLGSNHLYLTWHCSEYLQLCVCVVFEPLTSLRGPDVVWRLWFDVVSSAFVFLYCHRVDKNKHVILCSAIIVASGTYSSTEVILVTFDWFQMVVNHTDVMLCQVRFAWVFQFLGDGHPTGNWRQCQLSRFLQSWRIVWRFPAWQKRNSHPESRVRVPWAVTAQ